MQYLICVIRHSAMEHFVDFSPEVWKLLFRFWFWPRKKKDRLSFSIVSVRCKSWLQFHIVIRISKFRCVLYGVWAENLFELVFKIHSIRIGSIKSWIFKPYSNRMAKIQNINLPTNVFGRSENKPAIIGAGLCRKVSFQPIQDMNIDSLWIFEIVEKEPATFIIDAYTNVPLNQMSEYCKYLIDLLFSYILPGQRQSKWWHTIR